MMNLMPCYGGCPLIDVGARGHAIPAPPDRAVESVEAAKAAAPRFLTIVSIHSRRAIGERV